MKSWTDEPTFTVEPIDGWVPTTLLLGLPDTPETVRPCPCSVLVAWATVSWMTFWTCTVGGPVETLTVTAEPYAAGAPLAGGGESDPPSLDPVPQELTAVIEARLVADGVSLTGP